MDNAETQGNLSMDEDANYFSGTKKINEVKTDVVLTI